MCWAGSRAALMRMMTAEERLALVADGGGQTDDELEAMERAMVVEMIGSARTL